MKSIRIVFFCTLMLAPFFSWAIGIRGTDSNFTRKNCEAANSLVSEIGVQSFKALSADEEKIIVNSMESECMDLIRNTNAKTDTILRVCAPIIGGGAVAEIIWTRLSCKAGLK